MNLQCTCVKLVCTTLQSAINPHPSTKDATSVLLLASMDQRGQRHGRRVRGHGRGARGRGVCVCGGGAAAARGQNQAQVSNEIRATIIDHVINHGVSFREAGQRAQPILSRSTVASIVRLFRNENK